MGKMTFDPSGSRTSVTISSAKASRGELKAGLKCQVTYTKGANRRL